MMELVTVHCGHRSIRPASARMTLAGVGSHPPPALQRSRWRLLLLTVERTDAAKASTLSGPFGRGHWMDVRRLALLFLTLCLPILVKRLEESVDVLARQVVRRGQS